MFPTFIRLNDKQIQAIRSYKYHGGDPSLLYKYVLSPFAEFVVHQFIPRSMSPNMITFLGLIVSLFATILTIIFNPDLSVSCPSWLAVITGISIFAYQTLDNMDGKQARRTNSSSCLGLLFDHGCDAINAGLLSVAMGSVFGTGWTCKIFLCYFIAFFPFYTQTWEEYYSGAMILPLLNGPSEGLFLLFLLSLYSAFYGSYFWQERSISIPNGYSYIPQTLEESLDLSPINSNNSDRLELWISPYQIIIVTGVIWSLPTIVLHIFSVLKMAAKKGFSSVRVMCDLLPMAVFLMNFFIWCWISSLAFPKYPLITASIMGNIFVEITIHIMICHISNSETQPFQRYLSYSTFLLVLLSISSFPYAIVIEEYTIILLFLISTFITYCTAYQICQEVAKALNINIFYINKTNES